MAEDPGRVDSTGSDTARLVAWGDELIKLHDGFRRDLTAIRREAARIAGGQAPTADRPAAPAFDLRRHCLTFCEQLHEHHTVEDDVLFPHLAQEHPELAEVLERLRREHHVVARILDGISAAFAELGADAASDPRRADRLGADLERLATELEAHLDYEEKHLVPVLNALTSLPDGV